ncbi:MAG: class I SAM-dependent methyltransferase [Acidiferrobacterales bacterium]
MNLYSHWILPRLLDFSMRNQMLLPYRQRVVSASLHRVLEVGVGSGLNLPLYQGVDCICGIDPSAELIEYSRRRAKEVRSPVSLARASAEALPFANGSFDTVVMTWSLCSIRNPLEALQQMYRVLKPEGRLLFVEHGLAPDRSVQRWQNMLTPVWGRISAGCHLNRKIDDLVRAAGFRIEDLRTGYLEKGPKLITYMYEGQARRE